MKYLFFALILYGTVFLKAEAFAQATNPSVRGKLFDKENNLVNAHGAGILYYQGVYYLFGEIKKGKTWRVSM